MRLFTGRYSLFCPTRSGISGWFIRRAWGISHNGWFFGVIEWFKPDAS
jgi:hypothetical protein